MKLRDEQMIDLLQYAFTRLDGAWFMGVAKKHGIEGAWKADIEAWKNFSYLMGKRIRKNFISDPVWPQSFLDAVEIMAHVMKIKGRELTVDDKQVMIRVTDCEVQKMIAKAGIADCGIATIQTYQGITKGLFADKLLVKVEHLKNLNHGDDCCLVRISSI